ncbi:MAG: CHASE2 domain-containing protein [Gammaproteobacteria bacterium]
MRQGLWRRLVLSERLILSLLLVGLTALLYQQNWLWRWDQAFYDANFKVWSQPPPDDVVIVAIDAASLAELGSWPWPRRIHAKMVEILTRAGAKAIIFDVVFAEPDRGDSDSDRAFIDAVRSSGRVILPIQAEQLQSGGHLIETLPFVPLAGHSAALGHIHFELDSDGIARSVYLMEGLGEPRWPTLSLAALRFLDRESWRELPGMRNPELPAFSPYNWVRDYHLWIPYYGPPGWFPRISYQQVLKKDFLAQTFHDKIVLIGSTISGLNDSLPTPVSGLSHSMPGVEVHANLLSALIEHRSIEPVGQTWQISLAVFFALMPALMFPQLSPRASLICAGLLIVTVLLLSTLLLRGFLLWFQPVPSILALSLSYPFWSWRRLEFMMRYLNRELERLHAETKTLTTAAVPEFPLVIEFIQRMFPIDGWQLADAPKRFLQQGGVPPNAVARKLSSASWVFDRESLWTLYQHHGASLRLGLHWQSSNPPSERQLALLKELLTTPNSAAEFQPSGIIEVVQARLQGVQEATERLRSMRRLVVDSLSDMADGVLISSLHGQILIANPQAARYILGDSREILTGKNWVDLLPRMAIDEIRIWQQGLSQTLTERIAVNFYARNRQGRDLFVQMAPLTLGEGHERGVIINLTDITMIKENERRRSELLGFLSHDLKSPLVSILALLDLARERKQASRARPELLSRIEHYTRHLLEFSDNFLQLTKAEGPEEIVFQEINLADVAFEAVEQLWPQAKEKRIIIKQQYDSMEVWIRGDVKLLERAIVNLLSNSIKYSSEDSEIELNVGYGPEGCYCCVKDHGMGISEHYMPMIFDRFSRDNNALSSGVQGQGLGLAFVKAVIDKHKGRIEVQSELGKGSCFCLLLPAAVNSRP